MVLTAYTTFADIRSILGLSDIELTDSDLGLESYIFGLEVALTSVGSTLEEEYAVASSANTSGALTTVQKELYRAVRLFSTIFTCLTIAYSLPMRGQKSITDGKAGFTRFTDAPAKAMVDNLIGQLATAKAELVKQYAISTGQSSSRLEGMPAFMGVVIPAVDPVTG